MWYYRNFRHWFQPGPTRPVPLKPGTTEVREPPRSDGMRYTDIALRIGQFEGTSNWATFADKTAVKHYARMVLGEGYTIDTLGLVYPESAPRFRPPIDGLEDYAFKASNLAGINAIVKGGKMIVCQGSFAKGAEKLGMGSCLNRKLNGDLFDHVVQDVARRHQNPGRERQYERMRNSLIMEKLYDGDNIPADYKFFCSRGNVMFLKEVAGRYAKTGKRRGYYLIDWTWLPDVF